MKMKLTAILFLCLLIAMPALAGSLTRAALLIDADEYLGMPGFSLDDVSGDFTLTSLPAEALKRAIESNDVRAASSGGIAVFYLEIQGNVKTGLYAPVLKIAYAGPRALNATALSLRIGDMRYDFALAREDMPGGVEGYAALLTRDGVTALKNAAGGLTLRLHGDKSYTTEIKGGKADGAKARLQNHALSCVDLADALASLGFDAYAFTAENAEAWFEKTGVRPMFDRTDLLGDNYPVGKDVPVLDKGMGLLSVDGASASLKLLREKLFDMRMLTNAAATTDSSLKRAIEDLQAANGLIPSGSVDSRLLKILYGTATDDLSDTPPMPGAETVPADAQIDAEPDVAYQIDGVMSLALNRYWAAGRITTTKASSALSYQDALNTDHVLLTADGSITNLLLTEMNFKSAIDAQYILDGKYAFAADVRCESDGGARLDTGLFPLGQSRVFITAEVPKTALNGGVWTLTLKIDGRTLNYALRQ